jgi:hypothetical protein
MISRLILPAILAVALTGTPGAQGAAQSPSAGLATDLEIEHFLSRARVVAAPASAPDTHVIRVRLTDGTITHDAQVEVAHERDARSVTSISGQMARARDTWMHNVAAYRLDRLLGLHMVPVSVPRQWQSAPASFTWWIDDVLLDEGERLKQRQTAPDTTAWRQQLELLRLFDQLIDNVDRNPGNILYTSSWRIWGVDHTRAFGTNRTLRKPAFITRCDRLVLERLRQLDPSVAGSMLGEFLSWYEIDALLARRDAIVALLDAAGPSALIDRR